MMKNRYRLLSDEYYDRKLHPTCHNFREISATWLKHQISALSISGNCLEIGAGKSILASLRRDGLFSPKSLDVSDENSDMLEHSREYEGQIDSQFLFDVFSQSDELISRHYDLVVSSLGDPYNGPTLFRHVSKALKPGGVFLYTTPSLEWSREYRKANQDNMLEYARFTKSDGSIIDVPSIILTQDEQVDIAKDHLLMVKQISNIYTTGISVDNLSPKLNFARRLVTPVITSYEFMLQPPEIRLS